MENEIIALIDIECESEREFGFDRVAMRIARYSEVTDVAVVSGRADLTIRLKVENIDEISRFVTEILAPMRQVKSTATHFFMKNYKRSGKILMEDPKPTRIPVSA